MVATRSIFEHYLRASLVVLLITTLLIGGVIYIFSDRMLEESLEKSLRYHAELRKEQILELFDQQKRWTKQLSQTTTIRINAVQLVRAYQEDGVDSERYQRLSGFFRSEYQPLLRMQEVDELFIVSPQGALVFSLQPMQSELGVDLSENGFYGETVISDLLKKVKSEHKLVVSNFGWVEQMQRATVLMGEPLFTEQSDGGKRLSGVLVRPFSLDQLSSLLESHSGLGETGDVVVAQQRMDRQGINFINHYRVDLLHEQDEACAELMLNEPERFSMTHALQKQVGSGWMLSGGCDPVYAVWDWIPELEWGMVVLRYQEEAIRPVETMRENILLSLPLLLLILVVVIYRYAHALVQPIEHLTEATKNHPIDVYPYGKVQELNLLAASLKEMVAAQKKSEQRLENKVEERTAELRQQSNENASILASIQEGLIVVDSSNRIVRVNSQLEQWTGLHHERLIGRSVQTLFVGEDAGLLPTTGEQILKNADKKLQKILDKRVQYLYQMCDESSIATLLVDEHGVVIRSNYAMEKFTGWKTGELVGQGLTQLIPGEHKEHHHTHVEQFFQSTESRMMGEGVFPLLNAEGVVLEVEVGLLPLHAEGRQIVLVLLHNPFDLNQWEQFQVTEFGELFVERHKERHLRGAAGQSVAVYVSGAPLFQAVHGEQQFKGAVLVLHDLNELIGVERARESNRTKDEFLAAMSHELRTPLASVIGNCELLSATSLQESQQRMLHSIDLASRGLLSIINDILDISKIESGKFEVFDQPYYLTRLVENLQQMFSLQASQAGLEFVVEFQSADFTEALNGDVRRINQVLTNLLGNAIKYSDQGVVTFSINVDKNSEQLQFTVEDQGIGIPPESLKRLFQPYEQGDFATTRRFRGAGLGLYISHSLVRQMGGFLQVESKVGKGSRFELYLPLKLSAVKESVRQDAEQFTAASSDLFSGRVLVAEDAPELQILLRRILNRYGAEAVMANNGQEAIELASAGHFDLVLMDMQMPVMNGIEATRRLRESGYEQPIYALTANMMPQHYQEFEAAGCSGFLGKPIDRIELRRTLMQHLQKVVEE